MTTIEPRHLSTTAGKLGPLTTQNIGIADAYQSAAESPQLLVLLKGPRLLRPDGSVLAVLENDGRWYTPQGLPSSGICVPVVKVDAYVRPQIRAAAARANDRAWLTAAVEKIHELAAAQASITSDDVWAVLEMPPRQSRMIGNALVAAQQAGLIEPTAEHRPSRRRENHSRPVRVWKSLRYGQQSIC